jgi:2-(1,2-epoxy-1,2-dihydrophenyl)acetyl-CoA isomerase
MTALSYEEIIAAAAAHDERLVEVERAEHHAIVRLADPEKLNVLSAPLMLQLIEETEGLVRDPAIRSIVLTGADPGFSAGGDLRMMQNAIDRIADPVDEDGTTMIWRWIRTQFGAMARLIARSDTAFIAAINGPAAGVGLAFALTCDLAVASEDAVLVPAFGRLGLLPEVGTSYALTRKLGYARAFEFFVAGRHVDGRRAAELGLVNEVVPHDELIPRVVEWCERIAKLPPHALAAGKPLLRAVADMPWEQAIAMEEFAEPMCFTTGAFRENVGRLLASTKA